MIVDGINFTPWSSLAGGALIGLAASLFAVGNGRIAGISGLIGSVLQRGGEGVSEKALFLLGLLVGGCVWADSALAGRRSRFDMAFRREMKRVLPDRDFETVEDNHEMFDTFFDRISLPPGMNGYF